MMIEENLFFSLQAVGIYTQQTIKEVYIKLIHFG